MASFFEKGRGDTVKVIDGKKVKGGYRYDFKLYGQRHRAPRGFATKRDSDDAEAALRRRLMLQHAGVTVPEPATTSPRIHNWAGIYKRWIETRAELGEIKRPEIIVANIRSVLRFFGRKPASPTAYVHDTAPYHDLTLADPIIDPSWLRRFDEWLTEEGFAGQTRNHYNTTLSRMYWLALQPEYRDQSGPPAYNPFKDRPRHKWKRRTSTLTAADIQRWIQQASYHTRLAISIATLNPKFRLKNVLQLEWTDIDFEQRLIRVWDHKTDESGKALVSAIPDQLVNILKDARRRHPNAKHVILYRGAPVNGIDESLRSAAIAAGLSWGRYAKDGVTFHSLRHFASTQLARLQIPADRRKDVTGHADLKMELWYTHLFPEDERAHTEALSNAVTIAHDVIAGPTRVTREKSRRKTKPSAAGKASPRLKSVAGGQSGQGSPTGEPSRPGGGVSGVNRALAGLRRGPQVGAPRRRKLLLKK